MKQSSSIKLLMPDPKLTGTLAYYYKRNMEVFREFEEIFEYAKSEQVLAKRLEQESRDFQNQKEYNFYIALKKQPNKIIGSISLRHIVRENINSADLYCDIDTNYMGRGIASEAVSMVIRFAFEELFLHRLQVDVITTNQAAIKVFEKNKFRTEGIFKDFKKINGNWTDCVHMSKINLAEKT